MTIVRYRLVLSDGSHTAWTTDKEMVEKDAKFFRARIETWIVELP